MAMICAGIERSKTIKRSHLETANALWQYCEDSARFVFSGRDTTGGVSKHGERAQKLLASLRDAGADGLTRTQIMDVVFSKDLPASEITALLTNLKDAKLASMKVLNITDSRGRRRSVERWFAATTEPPGGITG
jgi:hypothetical protein